MLVLHLVPDGVGALHAFLNLIGDTHLLESVLDGSCELVEEVVTRNTCRGQFRLDGCVLGGVFELETEVLEFGFHLIESETVGQWGVDIECLTRNLILFVGRLRVEGAHVVQTVADLDEDDADIVAHGQQQFLEVLCNLCDLRSEDVLDILHRVVGILDDVVQEGCTDTGGAQSDLCTGDLCHGDGVHDIRFAR